MNKTSTLIQKIGVKTNRTSFLCRNRHHNTELRTSRQIIVQNVQEPHKVAKILLKVALNTNESTNQSK